MLQEWLKIFPWLVEQNTKGIISEDGEVKHVVSFVLNKNIGALCFILWPLLCLTYLWFGKAWRWHLILGILAATILLTAMSASETAKVGLLLSLITFALMYFAIRHHIIHFTIKMIWIAAFVFTIPLMSLPFNLGLHQSDWLPFSARDRIYIWSYTAEHISDHMLFGIGIRSTRTHQKSFEKTHNGQKAGALQKRPGWHAHNLFLQTWYEMGLIGAAILTTLGLAILSLISRLVEEIQTFAYSGFVMALTLFSFGWGMWQSWLLASAMLCIIAFALANEFLQRKTPHSSY
ncbi:MAG: O-antigen ligase family protein [Pseudomonadota bacterium]